jgi:hypothetical protein
MLVMCCKQKQTEDGVQYQKQISLLSSLFISEFLWFVFDALLSVAIML